MYSYNAYQTRTREEDNSWEELAVLRRREQHAMEENEIDSIEYKADTANSIIYGNNTANEILQGEDTLAEETSSSEITNQETVDEGVTDDEVELVNREIAQYLKEKKGILSSLNDIPIRSHLVKVFVKVSNVKSKQELFYLVQAYNKGYRSVQEITSDIYSQELLKDNVLYAKNNSGEKIELFVTNVAIELEGVTVYAYDTKRLDKLKELAENDKGVSGIFYNYPEEYAALLFASLNPKERSLIIKDEDLLLQIGTKLDNAQYAKGLEMLDIPLDKKLDYLWEGRTSFSGRGIMFQDIRGLLLFSGEEGKEFHNRLAEVFSVNDPLRIDFLTDDEDMLNRFIAANASKRHLATKKPGQLLYDDMLQNNEIGLSESESELVENIISKNKSLKDISTDEKKKYITLFKRNALKVTYELLKISEKSIIGSSNELLKGLTDEIFNDLKKHKASFEKMNELDSNAIVIGMGYDPKDTPYNKNSVRQGVSRARSEKAQIEASLRSELSEKYLILKDPNIDLQSLYNSYGTKKSSAKLEKYLTGHLGTLFENIQETRRILRKDPEKVLLLENVVEQTKLLMDMPSEVFDEIIDEKIKKIKWDNAFFQIAMAALSIGLAIASFGTLSPFLVVFTFIVSGVDFYYTNEDYQFESTTGNTSFDPETSLSNAHPSVIWVIASLAGAIGDAVSVLKLIKPIKLLTFTKTGQGAAEIASDLKQADLLIEGVSEADIVKLLKAAGALKKSIKKQLFTLLKGQKINIAKLDEMADAYLAERFTQLKDAKNADEFIKKDLPDWIKSKENDKFVESSLKIDNGTDKQNWKSLVNIRKASENEIEEATIRIKQYRTENNLKGKNCGYLEGNVNGDIVDNKIWVSGEAKPDTEPQIFKAIKVEGSGGRSWLRNTDSEYKMLNKLANDLGGKYNPNIKGEIKIISELEYCSSCQSVIQQFNEMFPNIKLILINGAK